MNHPKRSGWSLLPAAPTLWLHRWELASVGAPSSPCRDARSHPGLKSCSTSSQTAKSPGLCLQAMHTSKGSAPGKTLPPQRGSETPLRPPGAAEAGGPPAKPLRSLPLAALFVSILSTLPRISTSCNTRPTRCKARPRCWVAVLGCTLHCAELHAEPRTPRRMLHAGLRAPRCTLHPGSCTPRCTLHAGLHALRCRLHIGTLVCAIPTHMESRVPMCTLHMGLHTPTCMLHMGLHTEVHAARRIEHRKAHTAHGITCTNVLTLHRIVYTNMHVAQHACCTRNCTL